MVPFLLACLLTHSLACCRKESKRFVTHAAYPTTLVFCAGCAYPRRPPTCASRLRLSRHPSTDQRIPLRRPNASASGSTRGSMRRTFCQAAHDERSVLEAGTAWAIYAALAAAAQCGCDVVLVPFVSGGLYAGPWRGAPGLLASFVRNIDAMLLEGVMPDGTAVPPLGGCFRKVCVVVLPNRDGGQEESQPDASPSAKAEQAAKRALEKASDRPRRQTNEK